jgi:hypothetical protein
MVDGYTAAGTTADWWVDTATPPVAGAAYHRLWVRQTTTAGTGTYVNLGGISSGGGTGQVETYLHEDGSLHLQRFDRFDALETINTPPVLDAGVWHLLEVYVTGLGSADGGARLYVDGAPIEQLGAIDWTGVSFNSTFLSQSWGTASWLGTVDYDDVRMSTAPPASTLSIAVFTAPDAGAAAATSLCLPLIISLRSSSGAAASAPYDLDVALRVDGGPAVVVAPDCSTPVTTVHFDAGDGMAGANLVASAAGSVQLLADHPDFLPAAATVVVPSLGSPLVVGCDCHAGSSGSSPLGVGAFGLALWAATRRGRRALRTFAPRVPGGAAPRQRHGCEPATKSLL